MFVYHMYIFTDLHAGMNLNTGSSQLSNNLFLFLKVQLSIPNAALLNQTLISNSAVWCFCRNYFNCYFLYIFCIVIIFVFSRFIFSFDFCVCFNLSEILDAIRYYSSNSYQRSTICNNWAYPQICWRQHISCHHSSTRSNKPTSLSGLDGIR